jgi:uncharacterized membrane protein YgcG
MSAALKYFYFFKQYFIIVGIPMILGVYFKYFNLFMGYIDKLSNKFCYLIKIFINKLISGFKIYEIPSSGSSSSNANNTSTQNTSSSNNTNNNTSSSSTSNPSNISNNNNSNGSSGGNGGGGNFNKIQYSDSEIFIFDVITLIMIY